MAGDARVVYQSVAVVRVFQRVWLSWGALWCALLSSVLVCLVYVTSIRFEAVANGKHVPFGCGVALSARRLHCGYRTRNVERRLTLTSAVQCYD